MDIQGMKLEKVKIIKKSLTIVGIILVVLITILVLLKFMDFKRNKILLDNVELPIDKLTYNVGDKTYVNLREFTKFLPSYHYNPGEYSEQGTVSQNPNYFYLKSPYEVIQFKKESNNFIKYILIDQNYYQYDVRGNKILSEEEIKSNREIFIERQQIDNKIRKKEDYKLSSEVLEISDNQFIPIEDVKYIFNLSYNKTSNQIELYTVEYLEKTYAGILRKNNLHLNPNYQNRRAIIDGYFVTTSNLTNPTYGIQIYENGSFRSQISESYKDVRYVQNNKTIFVINNVEAFGLINIEKAMDIIKPGAYKSIDAYLPELDLYKVEDVNGKFGIIDASSDEVKTVVHISYDEIGYNVDKFPNESTGKIFFDTLIPAREGNRWYIFDLKNPGANYGANNKGYVDLGYRKPEEIIVNSEYEVQFSEEQKKELIRRGMGHLITIDRNSTDNEKYIRLQLLAKEGFVSNLAAIPEGDSILTVPEKTGYGGLIVKYLVGTEYGYNVIIADSNIRKKEYPYALNTPYRRIYRLMVNGEEKYYAIAMDENGTKYELIKRTFEQKKDDTNISTE